MMEFNIFFTLVSALSFSIRFDIDSSKKQDYLVFLGDNDTVHLLRENNTLILYTRQNESYNIYNYYNITDDFSFTWDGYKINEETMVLVESVGTIDTMFFDSYTFLSPITDFYEPTASTDPVYSHNGINYGYITMIVVGVILAFESKVIASIIYKKVLDRFEFISLNEELETAI